MIETLNRIPLAQLQHRVCRYGLMLAALGFAACALGWRIAPRPFFSAWLTAYLYWLGITLGCLAVAMVHGMTGGGWGRTILRVLEAGYQTLPVLIVGFIPIWLGAEQIYAWLNPDFIQHYEAVAKKTGYLNHNGFQTRAILYLLVWVVIGRVLDRSSPNEEHDPDSPRSLRRQRQSGICFILYGFSMTLAAVDWVMSLEPEWFSTMYGLIHLAGQTVVGLAWCIVVVIALRRFAPWIALVTPQRLNDLGNLLLAAVMFWAYCSYFQFLVIWMGNLPEENIWYVRRLENGWQYLALLLLILHFALPFLLLLSRQSKRQPAELFRICMVLLVMHYGDLYWQIIPGFQSSHRGTSGQNIYWLDAAAMLAIGGPWLALFSWRLSIRAELPLYDADLKELVDVRTTAIA